MKYIIYILLFFSIGIAAKAQLPSSTFPSRIFNGNTKASWIILDSPVVNPILDTFNARYPGTQLVRIQGGDTAFWFSAGGHLWFRGLLNRDTASLSNRINLKLNITDTIGKWLAQSTRLVDTMYRVNDSTVGYAIKGSPYTFQILGRSSGGGGGGSGTVTSVALSMPSAFSVSGSPITTSGTLNVTMPGLSTQYVRANGTVATTDTGMIPNFYLKVRSLLSGTSPIVYNSTTGGISIPDANNTGTKGAATFNNSDFTDNGAGLISLRNPPGGPAVDTIFRIPGIDSIYFKINGTQHAILDSAGGGGGGGTVTSVSGTTNRISVINPTTTPVVDIAATYVGQTSITTLGTIGTGVWNGTTIGPTFGGTGQNTVTTGDLLYGSASNTWSKLADVSTGNALISGGVGTAPSWGKIDLTTHVTGILPIANGGTGTSSPSLVAGTNVTITGSWPNQTINSTGGSGSPGGSNTQVQFNDAGSFGGDAGFVYDKTSNTIVVDSARLLNLRINQDPYNADSVHFRGTSITVGVGQTTGNRYSTVLSNKLNSIESNAGISGATLLNQGVANIPTLPVFSRAKYRWIVLEWGVNDINNAGTDSTAFDTTYREYIDTLVIARGWPASRIVILAPSYIDPVAFPTSTLAKQQKFRGATYSIAIAKGTKWVDIYSAELYRNPTNLLVDGIHPNDYGAYVYVNSIYKEIGDSVMSTDQNMSINGYVEFQRLKLRNSDTATYKSVVIGQDSTGNVIRYSKDQIIQNSTTLPTPQGASISLVGGGYFGNVTSPTAVEVIQVNGMIKGTSLRATGSSPSGLTGEGVEIDYIGGKGVIFGYDRDASAPKPLSLNFLGEPVMINTTTPSGGTDELLQVSSGGVNSKFGRFTGFLSGTGYAGAAAEIGVASSTAVLVGYDRTAATGINLNLGFGLSPFVVVGSNTVTGSAPFQVNSMARFSDAVMINRSALVGTEKLSVNGNINAKADSIGTPVNMLYMDDSGNIKKAAVPGISATTIYNGDGTLSGNRTVTGSSNSLTFDGLFNFRVNANTFLLAKSTPGTVYTTAVIGPDNAYEIGYTPTPTVYSKGTGIIIDTNNNASLGTAQIPSSAPLYATGSAFADGFQNQSGNFLLVTSITSNATVDLAKNFYTIDATSGNITITLPAASAAFGAGMALDLIFKRIDNSGNTVTIQRATSPGTDTIDGATSFTLPSQYDSKKIRATSTSAWSLY